MNYANFLFEGPCIPVQESASKGVEVETHDNANASTEWPKLNVAWRDSSARKKEQYLAKRLESKCRRYSMVTVMMMMFSWENISNHHNHQSMNVHRDLREREREKYFSQLPTTTQGFNPELHSSLRNLPYLILKRFLCANQHTTSRNSTGPSIHWCFFKALPILRCCAPTQKGILKGNKCPACFATLAFVTARFCSQGNLLNTFWMNSQGYPRCCNLLAKKSCSFK